MSQFEEIREVVEAFDRSIRICADSLGDQFFNYPKGSCGAASELLAEFLKASGFGVFAYVSGRDKDQSHAWLEQDRLIVDITAGQFCDAPEPIMITVDGNWHERFQARQKVPDGSFKSWGGQTAELAAIYSRVLKHLSRP